ncbi:MAG: hypothetical protein JRN35_10800 [Nitrososphaerota archaeon]|nr:hypothetical protein [Nitrososphaerota archaeon]
MVVDATPSYISLYRECNRLLTPPAGDLFDRVDLFLAHDTAIIHGLKPTPEEVDAHTELSELVDRRADLSSIGQDAQKVFHLAATELMGYILTGVDGCRYGGEDHCHSLLGNPEVLDSFWNALKALLVLQPFLSYEVIGLFPGISTLSDDDRSSLVIEVIGVAGGVTGDEMLLDRTLEHGLNELRSGMMKGPRLEDDHTDPNP